MRSCKKKEYILILILLCTPVTLCNPCVNQTLNAIPYPNDCQAFILCWLSQAYLHTCPNGLFFDIKTNNCQPLVTTTCCNVTLPILIIPVHIYQGSTDPTNKTNIWTATTTKQTNSSSTTPLLPTLKTTSTFITSSNQPEATTSIISILSTESSDSSQSSEFTLHVTEQTEITTRLEPAHIDNNVTKSTKAVNSSQPHLYKTSTITSYTEFHTKKPSSTLIVSTGTSEATTPLWTDSRLTSPSGFTLNTTEKVITIPQTSTFVTELRKSEESKKIESQTNVSTSSAFVTSIDSSNKTPNSRLITSTNPSQPTTPIIFTLWSVPTDSREISSSSGYTLNVELSTTPLETTSTYIDVTKKQSKQPNVYSTPPIVSSTEYSNYTRLTSTSNRNPPPVVTFNSTLNPLNTEGPHTSAMSAISTDTLMSSKTFPIITSDSFSTELQTFTESSTWQPPFSSTVNIPSSLNSSFFPTIYSTTELERAPKTTQYYRNTISAPSLSSLSESTQASITMALPTLSTDFTENYEYITRENLSTTVPSHKSYTLPELKTDNINFLTTTSITATVAASTEHRTATEFQIFTESSTLQPLVSATANIVTSTKIPYFPTIISTTKRGQPSTTTQYSVEDTATKSSPYFTEPIAQESVSTMTTEYIPTTITSSASQLEIFNKTTLLTTTGHSVSAVTSQSLPSQFISSTNAPKSETTVAFSISSSSESTEATKYITKGTETTLVTFLTTDHSSSPMIFTNTVNSTWDPVTDKLTSSPSNLKSTTDYTTIIPVTTVSTSYSSHLNINNNSHFTSTFQPKFTKTTKYDTESLSTTVESFPISTEVKHRSAETMELSISTTEPTISTENSLHTESETHTIQSTISEEIKSTHSTLLPSITIFTSKSITSSPDTTIKPIVTQTVRTLPPLPYSPPPCVFATTTQKPIISEKTSHNIPPIMSSTYIAPEISTNAPFSKPVCGFWDKFVFPDESDCKHYYECLFGGIRKVSCRYGYEFNPYALKCMPHLEANCQRRKTSKEVLDFLYYIMKLNGLSASGPTEH